MNKGEPTGRQCKKCGKDILKSVEVANVSEHGDFATYNYNWSCPCGYSNESASNEC